MTARQRAATMVMEDLLPVVSRLESGLRDMIRGERIVEGDIPDDWEWLISTLSDAREKIRLCEALQKRG